jgi:maltose O-acetyltransferase
MKDLLKTVFGNFNLKQAMIAELEEWCMFLFSSIPGFIGFILRHVVYKLFFAKVDSMPCIRPGVRFSHMSSIKLGRGVCINSNTYVYGRGGVEFGDYALIGPNCTISSGDHNLDPSLPISHQRPKSQRIVLGRDCWIGANVVIVGGVTIGEGVVVGGGAVVTGDLEPFGIYVGVPARKLRQRDAAVPARTTTGEHSLPPRG